MRDPPYVGVKQCRNPGEVAYLCAAALRFVTKAAAESAISPKPSTEFSAMPHLDI